MSPSLRARRQVCIEGRRDRPSRGAKRPCVPRPDGVGRCSVGEAVAGCHSAARHASGSSLVACCVGGQRGNRVPMPTAAVSFFLRCCPGPDGGRGCWHCIEEGSSSTIENVGDCKPSWFLLLWLCQVRSAAGAERISMQGVPPSAPKACGWWSFTLVENDSLCPRLWSE